MLSAMRKQSRRLCSEDDSDARPRSEAKLGRPPAAPILRSGSLHRVSLSAQTNDSMWVNLRVALQARYLTHACVAQLAVRVPSP